MNATRVDYVPGAQSALWLEDATTRAALMEKPVK
jgi:hypothetical protein